jgi:hypothetical protein
LLPIELADDEQQSVVASEKAGPARFPAAAHVIAPVANLRTLFLRSTVRLSPVRLDNQREFSLSRLRVEIDIWWGHSRPGRASSKPLSWPLFRRKRKQTQSISGSAALEMATGTTVPRDAVDSSIKSINYTLIICWIDELTAAILELETEMEPTRDPYQPRSLPIIE